ncbi:MAG: stalk domain-containing protein, partial [Fervidobacterium sp.]
AYGEWKISFTLGKELKTGYDYLYIQFPQEMTIPCTSCAYAHCQDCFKINGVNAAGAGYVENYKNAIYLRVPTNLSIGQKIEVIISQSAAFQNPSLPGKYTLKVWTSQEPEKILSNEFEITSTKIEDLSVTVDPEFTNSKSKISFKFKTGRLGNLQNGKYIYINFPEEFTLPSTIRNEFVTVNTEIPSEVKITDRTLALRIASSIGNYRDVIINIYSSFGIVNPTTKGTYNFTVWTDSEIEPVSATFEIKERNFVRTLLQTNPIEPDGSNSFFKSQVVVSLLGETNTGMEIETFYKIDESDFTKYNAPFEITEGTHTVSYYSKTNTLTEDIQSKTFKIDTTAPQIVMNLNDPVYTSENSFVISGSISEPSTLYINGSYVDVKGDNSFAREFNLENGENTFTLRATDLAGNTSVRQVKVILDPTTPVLTVESPSSNWQQFKGTGILIKGSVYPENCNLYVNGEKITVDSEGKFESDYIPQKGLTLVPINFTAVYPLTGKSVEKKYMVSYEPSASKIILTIGKKEISVDTRIYQMDVAPFIDKTSGRTLVPVRFISEYLGFEVSWDPVSRQVTIKGSNKNIILTIGSKTAYINGTPNEMDVAPTISNSRTFVPLRFISEMMGYNVNWDSKTQAITITP